MDKKPSLWKVILVGLFMGAVGAIIGFFPFMYLHNFLNPYAMQLEKGSFQRFLLIGIPVYIAAVLYLPAAGAVVGLIAAIIGYLRKSRRIWLWAALAGFLLNFFFSFWAM